MTTPKPKPPAPKPEQPTTKPETRVKRSNGVPKENKPFVREEHLTNKPFKNIPGLEKFLIQSGSNEA